MNSFDINAGNIKNCPQDLNVQSEQIRRMAYSVRNCSQALNRSMQNPTVTKVLNGLYSKMLEEASKEKKLSAALEHAISFYDKAERAIINAGQFAGIDSQGLNKENSQPGTDARSWFRKVLDFIFKRDVDPELTATTAEQQAAADEQMKKRAEELRNQERFSQATWEKASVEERKKILQEYLHEMEAILGVTISGNIVWDNNPPKNGMINYGAYYPGSNQVHINQYILENKSGKDSYHLMTTITHEMRHAYQHEAVKHPDRYKVTKETADAWKESIRTYDQEEAKGYEAYRQILIERDARWFAGQK